MSLTPDTLVVVPCTKGNPAIVWLKRILCFQVGHCKNSVQVMSLNPYMPVKVPRKKNRMRWDSEPSNSACFHLSCVVHCMPSSRACFDLSGIIRSMPSSIACFEFSCFIHSVHWNILCFDLLCIIQSMPSSTACFDLHAKDASESFETCIFPEILSFEFLASRSLHHHFLISTHHHVNSERYMRHHVPIGTHHHVNSDRQKNQESTSERKILVCITTVRSTLLFRMKDTVVYQHCEVDTPS